MNDLVGHCHYINDKYPMPEGATHIDTDYDGRSSWEQVVGTTRSYWNGKGWCVFRNAELDPALKPIPIDFLLDIYEEPKVKPYVDPVLDVRFDAGDMRNMYAGMLGGIARRPPMPVFDVMDDFVKEPEVIAEEKRYAGDWRNQYNNNPWKGVA
tara:strand:- start:254 stop:712 length:459 start_codon:yes stop_codon:yes gene_type:complete